MIFKYILLVTLFYSSVFSSDDEPECKKKRYGYSYLAIGVQHTNYSQGLKSGSGDYELSSTSISPYYTTATLTRINKKFAFEIYAASTLFASTTRETLSSKTSNDSHKLDMTLTDIALTFHYKPLNEHHRLTFGGRYTYEVLKRHGFSSPSAKIKTINQTTDNIIENKIAAVSLDIGYLYMSKIETGIPGLNYRLGASFGIPFFTVTADTYATESYELNPSLGYKLSSTAYLGYTVIAGLELGIYTDLLYQVRFDEIDGIDPFDNKITSRESIKVLLNYGLMASWSF